MGKKKNQLQKLRKQHSISMKQMDYRKKNAKKPKKEHMEYKFDELESMPLAREIKKYLIISSFSHVFS